MAPAFRHASGFGTPVSEASYRRKGVLQITSSDGDLVNLKRNLAEVGIPREYFDDLFQSNVTKFKTLCDLLSDHLKFL